MIQERIYLDEKDENVYLDTYVSSNTDNSPRPAMLILPGGGYHGCSKREAEPIALSFLAKGVNCFVLFYRTGSPEYTYPTQLTDASRAILHIRQNAEKYEIDPARVFVTGFSAGGHLAGALAYMNDAPEVLSALGIQKGENKPNGAILCYPVVTALHSRTHVGSFKNLLNMPFEEIPDDLKRYHSLETHIDSNSPPTFIWHTAADRGVPPTGSLRLAEQLIDNGVVTSLRVYPYGGHGLSLSNHITSGGNPAAETPLPRGWVDEAYEWLSNLKLD